ncbi:hypothetical protein BGW38_003663 [Lunasporangiospora selenospora]|uniref:Uncharacterized protein n=1 Tax=Lunasporangiospora selenospora TaxID=979761 RepID=A0A9P6KC18_9FUNG|nr:hypothetical protein BGW38_003663 [Lunasporangiospora selenospora]
MTNNEDAKFLEDARGLKDGQISWIDVPFPYDSKWDLSGPYAAHFKQYHSLFVGEGDMPKVPSLMTYCTATHEPELSNDLHSHRVYWHSMVLRPEKWVISKDHNGLNPINGTDSLGKVTIETTEETTLVFKNSIEFDSSVTISGGEGPVSGSATLKLNASRNWTKSIAVKVIKMEQTEQGCSYQPTNMYAQLHCKVIASQKGSFMVSSFYDYDVVCTNPRGVEVKPEYRTSSLESAGSIGSMQSLYSAFGKDIELRSYENGDTWQKATLTKLKLVVDPLTANLNITGSAHRFKLVGSLVTSSSWKETRDLLDNYYRALHSNSEFERFWAEKVAGAYTDMGKLDDYRVLRGEDAGHDDEEIAYSPGNLVKVWRVTVRGDGKWMPKES